MTTCISDYLNNEPATVFIKIEINVYHHVTQHISTKNSQLFLNSGTQTIANR